MGHVQWAYSSEVPRLLSLSRIPVWMASGILEVRTSAYLQQGLWSQAHWAQDTGIQWEGIRGTGRDPRMGGCPTV